MRRFYKYTLCIIENFQLTNLHLHHGLLGDLVSYGTPARILAVSTDLRPESVDRETGS